MAGVSTDPNRISLELSERLAVLPAIDAHTHLVGNRLGARGLHDILLYHMAVSELYSAGCPSGARLTQYPGWPDRDEAHARICEALPYLRFARATGISWVIGMILRDLYDWREPVTEANWQRLDGIIRERADDGAWHRAILHRAGVERCGTELARREQGQGDDVLFYALEWGFFTRCQWGQFDTALCELERCWGQAPQSPAPIGGPRQASQRAIRTLDDVHSAVRWYVKQIPADRVQSMATHVSTDIDYRVVNDAEMAAAMARRDQAGPAERDTYASYVNEAFLTALEQRYGDHVLFQFSFGAEPLPFETASRLSQRAIAQLAEIIGRHPGLRFQCFLSSAHANQSLCTLCRELPNLSLAGFWWHNFFPSIIQRVLAERLDMLPLNRQVGFFSDAYCVEWVYGKSLLLRRMMAQVLAERVALGQFSLEQAVAIAAELLRDSTCALLRL
jgi:hypothetical protein